MKCQSIRITLNTVCAPTEAKIRASTRRISIYFIRRRFVIVVV